MVKAFFWVSLMVLRLAFGRYLVLLFIEAPFRDRAAPAFRRAGLADITAMKDEPVMGRAEHFLGDTADQLILHGTDRFAGSKARTVAETENMGIYSHGWLVKGDVEHDIGRFPAYAGQGFQRFTGVGNLPVMLFQKLLAEQGDIMGFGAPEPYGADMPGNAVLAQCGHAGGVGGFFIQGTGGLVDRDIRCLCRKHNTDEQLERVVIDQFAAGIRVGLVQCGQESPDGFQAHAGLGLGRACTGRAGRSHE